MITQNQYLELEAKIRKDLPRLMELSCGCLIKFWDNRIYTTVLNTSIEIAFIDRNSEYCSFQVIDPDQINIIEIIGHDILLSDVLEWLQNYIGIDVYYDQTELSISVRYHNGIDVSRKYVRWNLSKPYLKDQSDELKEFLYLIWKK